MYSGVFRGCDVLLPKSRDGEKESESSAEKEHEENIVVEMLSSKENWLMVSSAIVKVQNELLKETKHECLKPNLPREITLKWRSCGAAAGETRG